MYTLNIFPGISHLELLNILSQARRDSSWDSLRIVGLHPEDAVLVKSVLLHFLAERRVQEDHQWNSLLLFWLIPSKELEDLVNEILRLNIFHAVYLKCPNQTTPLPPTAVSSMSPPQSVISMALSSPSVEKITCCNVKFTIENARFFRDEVMRRRQYSAKSQQESACRQLHALEFITCSFDDNAFPFLGSALQALVTLDTLKFWYSDLSIRDRIHLLTCLEGHPTLTRLDWMERLIPKSTPETMDETQLQAMSLEDSLDRLLASTECKIRVLGLSLGSMETVGTLFSRLNNNDSVEWLDLSYNGNTTILTNTMSEDKVFGNLYKFHQLQSLDLFCTRLSSTAFDKLCCHPVPTLERISCWGDDLWEGTQSQHVTTVLKILDTHPSFIEFYGGLHWRTTQVQFLFDTRKVYHRQQGTASKDQYWTRDEDVPPSLWPLILERANRLLMSDQRRSRALYWLLKEGPAFSALPLNHYNLYK